MTYSVRSWVWQLPHCRVFYVWVEVYILTTIEVNNLRLDVWMQRNTIRNLYTKLNNCKFILLVFLNYLHLAQHLSRKIQGDALAWNVRLCQHSPCGWPKHVGEVTIYMFTNLSTCKLLDMNLFLCKWIGFVSTNLHGFCVFCLRNEDSVYEKFPTFLFHIGRLFSVELTFKDKTYLLYKDSVRTAQ